MKINFINFPLLFDQLVAHILRIFSKSFNRLSSLAIALNINTLWVNESKFTEQFLSFPHFLHNHLILLQLLYKRIVKIFQIPFTLPWVYRWQVLYFFLDLFVTLKGEWKSISSNFRESTDLILWARLLDTSTWHW